MADDVTVTVMCSGAFGSVLIRRPVPPVQEVEVSEGGCDVAVNLGVDDTETWETKTGNWEDA